MGAYTKLSQDSEAKSSPSLTMIQVVSSTPRLWALKAAHLPLNSFPWTSTGIRLGSIQQRHCNGLRNPTAHCQTLSDMPQTFRESLKPKQSSSAGITELIFPYMKFGPRTKHLQTGKTSRNNYMTVKHIELAGTRSEAERKAR